MSTNDVHFKSQPSSTLHTYFNEDVSTYEARSGGATRAVAEALIPYLEPLPQHAHIHDNASGPGITASALLAMHPSVHITCTDNAANMISFIRTITPTRTGWDGHITATVMDSSSLSFRESTFDISVTNFGIFLFPDPDRGAREIYRTLKRGGKAAVTAWKTVGWVPILRAIQADIMPDKPRFESSLMEEWSREERLVGCLVAGGFREGDIEVRECETAIWGQEGRVDGWMRDFAAMMGTMAGGQMSEVEKGGLEGGLRRLWEERREEFFVRGEGEGVFGVRMVAWIAVGRK